MPEGAHFSNKSDVGVTRVQRANVGGFFVDLTPGVQLSLAGGVGVLVGCAALALVVGVGSCGLRRMARGAILRGRGQVSC